MARSYQDGGSVITLADAQREFTAQKVFTGDARGRRLRRHLEAREQELKIKLLHFTPGGHPRVSLTELRLRCPELRHSSVDKIVRDFQKHLARFKEETLKEAAEERQNHFEAHIEPQMSELYARGEKTAEAVALLNQRVDMIAGTKLPKSAQSCPSGCPKE